MRILISIITLGSLLLVSVIGNVVVYGMWDKEKEHAAAIRNDLRKAEEKIQALDTNKDDELIKFGEKYVRLMFERKEGEGNKAHKSLISHSTGKAKGKLSKAPEKHHHEENEASGNLISNVKIMDSRYYKKSDTKADVLIQFNHQLESSTMKANTVNEIRLSLEYKEGKWKVQDFKLEQKI